MARLLAHAVTQDPLPAPLLQVALRGEPEDPVAVTLTSMDSATAAAPTNGNGRAAAAPARELPSLLPLDQVPQLPQVGGECS